MFPLILSLALAATALLSACGESPPDGERPEPVQDSITRAAVAEVARPVAASLMQNLSDRLQTAIAERGMVGAMEFCNVQALPLTRQVLEEQGMHVTRTSARLRNRENAPDTAAARALAWYRSSIDGGGGIPAYHVQVMRDGSYRYYQPLVAQEVCLQCHGGTEDLAEGVPEALARLYPTDEATGYRLGDWRGLLQVTVPASEVRLAGR